MLFEAKFYVDLKVANEDLRHPRAIYTYDRIPRKLLQDDVAVFSLDQQLQTYQQENREDGL